MGQLIREIQKELVLTDTAGADIDLYTGGLAGEQDLIQMLRIRNNDAVAQVVTIKMHKYDGGYSTTFERSYTILPGGYQLATDFILMAIIGAAANTGKLVIQFDTTMTGSDSIQIQGTAVRFS